MQTNKAILINSEIVFFDKNILRPPGSVFFQIAGSVTDFFSRQPYVYSFA